MSDLGQRVVEQARSYLGCPFFHAGRSREGLDCIGLVAMVAHDLGITDFDDLNYSPEPDPAYLTAVLWRFAWRTWDATDPFLMDLELIPGDLLQFELCGEARHVGIYGEDARREGTVIHCYQSAGKVVEHLFDKHWQKRLFAVYRFKQASWDGQGEAPEVAGLPHDALRGGS